MAEVSSFDVTSTVDLQEVDNAVNQARKEVAQRYDFKGSTASIDFNKADSTLTLSAEDQMKLTALWDVLQTRMVRRNVPVKNLKLGDIETATADLVIGWRARELSGSFRTGGRYRNRVCGAAG